jgi:peroxiredoxin Q/BCP
MALRVGTKAPDFALVGADGKTFTLSKDWAGSPGIIYFYPKDFTPGCTAEACAFRDSHQDLAAWGIPVVGISTDSAESHRRFAREHKIPFPLLSDLNGAVSKLYSAKVPFLNMSKRVTYLVDANHTIVAVVENFFVADAHVKEILAELKQLKAAQDKAA